MDDLIRFIEARLAEWEKAAKDVKPLGYTTDMGGTRLDEKFSHYRRAFYPEDGRSYIKDDPQAIYHFGLHDPPAVLRTVEHLRYLVRWAKDYWQVGADKEGPVRVLAQAARQVMQIVAGIWSDHPDYPG